jgi:hypothetical protein
MRCIEGDVGRGRQGACIAQMADKGKQEVLERGAQRRSRTRLPSWSSHLVQKHP